jgi:hypothetical protein
MAGGGYMRSLTALVVVALVLAGFMAFFVSFLLAPLIVMLVAYLLIALMHRGQSRSGTPGPSAEELGSGEPGTALDGRAPGEQQGAEPLQAAQARED